MEKICTNQFTVEQKRSKWNDFEKLFNSQIATLKDRGVPGQIIEALQSQKNVVVQKANAMTIGEGNIPFLPVIKPAYLGYYGLMAIVRNGLKEGYTNLKPAAIIDQFKTPDDLYYIYNVEDGNATLDKSPQDAEEIFKKQSRLCLTAAEVVNLCIFKDVLSKHFMWATGSCYEFISKVPVVCRDFGHRPKLCWSHLGGSGRRWGSPSCTTRS